MTIGYETINSSVRIIKRKRQSGKTTILLHYMTIKPSSILVCRTQADCEIKKKKAYELQLDIEKHRFINLVDAQNIASDNEVLIDDVDCLIEENLSLVLPVLKKASIVTLTKKGD